MGGAYLRVPLIHGLLRYISSQRCFPEKRNKRFYLKDITDFWFVKPDPNMITLIYH